MTRIGLFALALSVFVWPVAPAPAAAQDASGDVVRLEARPAALTLRVGDETELEIVGISRSGETVAVDVRAFGPRQSLRVRGGTVTALEAGEFEVVATWSGSAGGDPLTIRVPVVVDWPAPAEVTVSLAEGDLHVGTSRLLSAQVRHADDSLRPDPGVRWESETPDVVTVDRFGRATGVAAGAGRIIATAEGVTGAIEVQVGPFTA
ncbi:MAG: hypothetical protein GWN71_36445, partial [Gammaproteobacteria bacterium]|nr:hypothetical protein [Gammaproteobacteria bacterium]